MPFYEYIALSSAESCLRCIEVLEIRQSITEDNLDVCPYCGNSIKKLVSRPGGVVIKNREANQYSDIKNAKYWRDKNGVRHKVESSDGYSGSSTVKKQTASPELIKERKKRDKKKNQKQRLSLQKKRANDYNKWQQEK